MNLSDTVLAYDLPKTHKQDIQLCSIIYLINSPTHFLTTVVYSEIKNNIPSPKSHINNRFDYKLQDLEIDDSFVFHSLDVTSFFNYVPCDLVLEGIDGRYKPELQNSLRCYPRLYVSFYSIVPFSVLTNKFYK